MYSLSECFRSESNSETLRWKIRWIFLRKLFTYGRSTIFVKNSISYVPLSLNTTRQIASHYQLCQKAKQPTYSLIKLLLAPQNR